MSELPRLAGTLASIRAIDPSCTNDQEALTVFGLLVFAAGLGDFEDLRAAIVLKGGTVLRILNQGHLDRLPTKDLDASLLAEPQSFCDRIETDVVDRCNELMRVNFADATQLTARHEQQDNRRDIDAQLFQFRLTLQAKLVGRVKPMIANQNKFKFEASRDEWIDPGLLMDFPDGIPVPLPISLRCYAPLQSLAEKLRAILQKRWQHERAMAEGKSPNQGNFPPRHVLDIETLYRHCSADMASLPGLFARKCAVKRISEHLIQEECFDHPELWRQVAQQCRDFGRDLERCRSVYWTCVRAALAKA